MRILAVSDEVNRTLEGLVTRYNDKFRDINLIVSCGDLENEYLEFLVNALNKDLLFVDGNHIFYSEDIQDNEAEMQGGRKNIHGRVIDYGNFLFTGFGGSNWYGGRGNEFTEKQMSNIVSKVIRKIKILKLKDKILSNKKKDIIVISHAPPYKIHDEQDPCHTGFRCFRYFIEELSPLIWIHGHVRFWDTNKTQISIVNGTTVVNAYGYKIIDISDKDITVMSNINKK